MFIAVALRIEPKESLPQLIRKIVRAQLEAARAAAIDPRMPLGERVHDVRTAMKKVRALNRLVRPATGKSARRADRRLRKIAHSVSALRDAGVVLKTFDRTFATERRASSRAVLARIRARLTLQLRAQVQAFERGRCAGRLRSDLAHERRQVDAWMPTGGDWRAIGEGLTQGYRRARKAMAAAYRTGSGVDFHTWRRTVKTHRHQVAALEELAPRQMKARLGELDRLGDWLGDEHDLTVLEAAVCADRSQRPEPGRGPRAGSERASVLAPRASGLRAGSRQLPIDHLLKRISRRRLSLRRRAQPLGKLLFKERPSAFRDRVRSRFRAARS